MPIASCLGWRLCGAGEDEPHGEEKQRPASDFQPHEKTPLLEPTPAACIIEDQRERVKGDEGAAGLASVTVHPEAISPELGPDLAWAAPALTDYLRYNPLPVAVQLKAQEDPFQKALVGLHLLTLKLMSSRDSCAQPANSTTEGGVQSPALQPNDIAILTGSNEDASSIAIAGTLLKMFNDVNLLIDSTDALYRACGASYAEVYQECQPQSDLVPTFAACLAQPPTGGHLGNVGDSATTGPIHSFRVVLPPINATEVTVMIRIIDMILSDDYDKECRYDSMNHTNAIRLQWLFGKAQELGETLNSVQLEPDGSFHPTGFYQDMAQRIWTSLAWVIERSEEHGCSPPMFSDIIDQVRDFAHKTIEWAGDHPVATTIFCEILAIAVLWWVAPWVLAVLGFAEEGVVEGSIAAMWQTTYRGYIPKGKLFSYLQHLGATLGRA